MLEFINSGGGGELPSVAELSLQGLTLATTSLLYCNAHQDLMNYI